MLREKLQDHHLEVIIVNVSRVSQPKRAYKENNFEL